MRNFESIGSYLNAFNRNPRDVAVLPLSAAAAVLRVARSSVERMASDGRLTLISVPGLKGIRAQDLCDILEGQHEESRKVVAVLERAARQRKPPVFYDAVMAPLDLDHRRSVDRAKIGSVLGQISCDSYVRNKILLSVLVHRKGGNAGATLPSEGFFNLAKDLGYEWEDEHTFVQQQMQRVYDHYANN